MKLTPMMRQYMEIKNRYKDYILFFRLGDFYEMFFDDAITASRELEITLTGKNCGMEERAPMCGVPFHSSDGYIARLVEKNYKVAICEQVEDAAQAKGLVKRDVVRIVTPGTIIDPTMLKENSNNYIMTISTSKSNIGIAYADITTGILKTTEMPYNIKGLLDEIIKINPREIVVDQDFDMEEEYVGKLIDGYNILFTNHYSRAFKLTNCEDIIKKHFKLYSLEALGIKDRELSIIAVGSLLDYIYETQKVELTHIDSVDYYTANDFMLLDKSTRRNLELTETIRGSQKIGSLLWVLDKTSTSMGARTLKQWIEEPLVNKDLIDNRLDAVEHLCDNLFLKDDIKDSLKKVYDLERLSSKIVYGTANGRDLMALYKSIADIPFIKGELKNNSIGSLKTIEEELDELTDIKELLENSIKEDPPFSVREGNIISDGYNEELDELRDIVNNGKSWLLEIERKEREATGIKNLKIKFNKVFGYYLEVTKSNLKLVPETYIRKQTLANAERYIMPELKEMEDKILGAEDKIVALEYRLFDDIRKTVLAEINRVISTAKALARLDVITSFSDVSYSNNYTRPIISNDSDIVLEESRHPVVEKVCGEDNFISNDTALNNRDDMFYIITGPNMAGKSTYLRQVALNVLMAQIGCFVPAKKANIGIVDRIFTRVGASDDLFEGQSTFMVEMSELSNILNNASQKSLIILDEIGRGTSTYDGLSIAWSVVEYISNRNILGAKTLFATHYHELTELEGRISGVKNYCISVEEVGEDIVFLRKIIRGGADQSYGIQVAKLAGVPADVITRAKEILLQLEDSDIAKKELSDVDLPSQPQPVVAIENKEVAIAQDEEQLNLFNLESNEIIEDLKSIDIMNLTPMDAMNALYSLVKKAKDY